MRIRWVIAAAAALALALLTLPADPWSELHFGEPAISAAGGACPANAKPANLNFTLKDLSTNRDVKLSSLRGKVILLDFWATWCGPCKIEIPWFIEFRDKYAAKGLEVVGVVTEDPDLKKVKPFISTWKMNYTILNGNDRDDVDDAFGPMFGLPVTVVISRDGKICGKHVGLTGKDRFEAEIKSLL